MGKCKNVECNNETEGNKVYCSLSCRNYYVNKYLRDYTKNGDAISDKTKSVYLLSPKKCKKCGADISYEKRKNEYCSKECSSACVNINRKGIKYKMTFDGISTLRNSAYDKLHNTTYNDVIDKVKLYEENPNKCLECGKMLDYNIKHHIFCDNKCRRNYDRKELTEFSKYKLDCKFKFSLNSYPNKFDFTLINEHGWYSAKNSKNPNLNGVSRDHMYSIYDGFKNNVDPYLISHPANCKLMIHPENNKKDRTSSITLEELISLVNKW